MARADARREAVELLVDLTVYAPIGLLSLAREHLPELAETGRNRVGQRVALARMIGELAVRQGKRELRRRLDTADASSTRPPATAPAPTTGEQATAADRAPTATAAPVDVPTPADLPIEGYESLAASQIVARLGTLDDDELAVIEAFERAHRDRRTVQGRIAQLRSER